MTTTLRSTTTCCGAAERFSGRVWAPDAEFAATAHLVHQQPVLRAMLIEPRRRPKACGPRADDQHTHLHVDAHRHVDAAATTVNWLPHGLGGTAGSWSSSRTPCASQYEIHLDARRIAVLAAGAHETATYAGGAGSGQPPKAHLDVIVMKMHARTHEASDPSHTIPCAIMRGHLRIAIGEALRLGAWRPDSLQN